MTVFDDLSLLRAFVCIVESGNISVAARKLQVTQPTLSRYLQTLEDRCGAVLLFRDTHRMRLSSTGNQFLREAQSLLSAAEEAELRLQDDQATLRGHIRLFSTIDFGQSVVSRLAASFIQANPAVTINLAYSNRPMHMLEEGCEIGIIAGTVTDDTIIAHPLPAIKRYLVASPVLLKKHKATVSKPIELQSWPWLALSGFQFGEEKEVIIYSAEQKKQRLEITPVLTSEGVTSQREAARMGLGIAVLPEWLIAEDIVSERLIRILPEWHAQDLPAHIVYPVQRRLPLRVSNFIDFASTYMTKLLKSGK
ncbi:LysR family transcriptional regulator [Desulfobacter vibrioformis]|uniref:LysR family transcriptional regulator n=1 Tax=Desulfobacter vibrioformis TaxID=34031 RepID=UPI00055504AC|nr:LysR family transcriptional regulator [Desulfobacter vibrioformis]